jgi:hypothetical protein
MKCDLCENDLPVVDMSKTYIDNLGEIIVCPDCVERYTLIFSVPLDEWEN